jgi:hypothetical protein
MKSPAADCMDARDTGPMRAAYVHQGILVMSSEADLDVPGAAVTLALCGSWDHRPPCPLAHHTHSERSGTIVRVRVVFATEPENEGDVRRRIDAAHGTGSVTGRHVNPLGGSRQHGCRTDRVRNSPGPPSDRRVDAHLTGQTLSCAGVRRGPRRSSPRGSLAVQPPVWTTSLMTGARVAM